MTLRVRLLLVLVGILAVGLVVSDVVTYTELRGYLVSQVDQQLLATDINNVVHGLEYCATYQYTGDTCFGPPNADPGAVLPAGDYGELVVGGQTYGAWLDTATHPTAVPRFPASTSSRPFTANSSTGASYRVVAYDLVGGEGTVFLAEPLAGVAHDASRLLVVEVLVTAGALLGLGLLAWLLVRRELRPLQDMATTAGAIAAGDLSRRVGRADDRSEVGQLASALNAMLGEIEAAFAARAASEEQLRRFLADASHELRTPLTSIRGYAEMFDRGARDHPEDLALVMRRIRAEADRMGVLVEDLLLLARLGQQRPISWEQVDLSGTVTDAVIAARVAHPDRQLTLQVSPSVTVPGDPGRLRQVVDNLVRNALDYSPTTTAVDVTLAAAQFSDAGLTSTGPAGAALSATVPPQSVPSDMAPSGEEISGSAMSGSGPEGTVPSELVPPALAFPGRGPVAVARAAAEPDTPGLVELVVSDRGPGIPGADRQRIFQPFERLDPSRTRATGGMGLGLAIVAAIVRAHGGRVWVEDRPGGGSCFRLQLLTSLESGRHARPTGHAKPALVVADHAGTDGAAGHAEPAGPPSEGAAGRADWP